MDPLPHPVRRLLHLVRRAAPAVLLRPRVQARAALLLAAAAMAEAAAERQAAGSLGRWVCCCLSGEGDLRGFFLTTNMR